MQEDFGHNQNKWHWRGLYLQYNPRATQAGKKKRESTAITSRRDKKSHSGWKHREKRRKRWKTSGVSISVLICLWKNSEAEDDSTCRHQNICTKSQQETWKGWRERETKTLKRSKLSIWQSGFTQSDMYETQHYCVNMRHLKSRATQASTLCTPKSFIRVVTKDTFHSNYSLVY